MNESLIILKLKTNQSIDQSIDILSFKNIKYEICYKQNNNKIDIFKKYINE